MAVVGQGAFARPAKPEPEQAMELLTHTHWWLLGETDHEDEVMAIPAAPLHEPLPAPHQLAERLGLARLDYRFA